MLFFTKVYSLKILSKNSERVLLLGTECNNLLDYFSSSYAIEAYWC